MNAVDLAFNVKSYTVSYHGGSLLNVTYYGILTNTVAVGASHEMLQNMILEWSIRRKDLNSQVAHNSYRRGAARGVYEAVKQERAREDAEAELEAQKLIQASDQQAAMAREAELSRLSGPSPSSSTPLSPSSPPECHLPFLPLPRPLPPTPLRATSPSTRSPTPRHLHPPDPIRSGSAAKRPWPTLPTTLQRTTARSSSTRRRGRILRI